MSDALLARIAMLEAITAEQTRSLSATGTVLSEATAALQDLRDVAMLHRALIEAILRRLPADARADIFGAVALTDGPALGFTVTPGMLAHLGEMMGRSAPPPAESAAP